MNIEDQIIWTCACALSPEFRVAMTEYMTSIGTSRFVDLALVYVNG